MIVPMTIERCKQTSDMVLLALSTLKMNRSMRRKLTKLGKKFVPPGNHVYLKQKEIEWLVDLSDWSLAMVHNLLKDKKLADQSTEMEQAQENFKQVQTYFQSKLK